MKKIFDKFMFNYIIGDYIGKLGKNIVRQNKTVNLLSPLLALIILSAYFDKDVLIGLFFVLFVFVVYLKFYIAYQYDFDKSYHLFDLPQKLQYHNYKDSGDQDVKEYMEFLESRKFWNLQFLLVTPLSILITFLVIYW